MQGWRKHFKLQVLQTLRRNCLHEHKQQLQYTPWNWNMSKFYEVADFKNSEWGNIALFKKVYITSQKNNIQSTAGFM